MAEKKSSYFINFKIGFFSFKKGYFFIKENHLLKYIIIPSIISAVIGIAMTALIYAGVSEWILEFLQNLSPNEAYEGWKQFFLDFTYRTLRVFAHLFSIILGMIATIIVYRILASVLVTPFLGPLVSKIEVILTGKELKTSIGTDIKNAAAGILSSVQNMLLELLIMVISGPLSPFLLSTIEGYFLGKGSFDYFFEKHAQTYEEKKIMQKKYRGEIQGLGMAHLVCLFIPILGVFIAPVLSITGAALVIFKK
ncbi:MAG: EI24 domain-containing protein [Spirochaetia bacterium]|nr:EI24 domain-containing protein [Spirochaetia bacterium]